MDVTEWTEPATRDEPYDGAERRLLAFDDELQLNHNELAAGIEYPVHAHEETTQGMFMIEGEVELYGDETVRIGAGDSVIIQPGEHHGIRGIAENSRLLVASTPPSGLPDTERRQEYSRWCGRSVRNVDRERLEAQLEATFGGQEATLRAVSRQAQDLADSGRIAADLGSDLTVDQVVDALEDAPAEHSVVERWNWWLGSLSLSHGGYHRFRVRPDLAEP